MMKLMVADNVGFCFGVKRAIDMVKEKLKEFKGKVYVIGDIIHNPQVVEQLEREGLIKVSDVESIPSGSYLVIRSHGAPLEIYEKAHKKGLKIIDTTCPNVSKVHRLIKTLEVEGYFVLIVGFENHPEVKAALSLIKGNRKAVVSCREDLNRLNFKDKRFSKLAVVCQTTIRIEKLREVVPLLIGISDEIRIFDTICYVTTKRQDEVRRMSKMCDAMIIVGGKNSSNTKRLAEVAKSEGCRVFHIETEDELDINELKLYNKIGIAGGTSTPYERIEAVFNKLKNG